MGPVNPRQVWSALIGVPAALEVWASLTDHPEWTLSPHARVWVRTDTAVGRAFVTVATGAGATWLAHHLITTPAPSTK